MRYLSPFSTRFFQPIPANVIGRDNEFDIQLQVPGVSKEDIAVTIEGRTVGIKIDKKVADQKVEDAFLQEFGPLTQAERSFQFRELLDAESAKLQLNDGLLTVSVGYKHKSDKRTLTLA